MSSTPTLVLGDLEITSIPATRFALDGGAMFGLVPRTAWEPLHPADAQHRIALVARILVITHRRAGYRAIIDAGLGDAWSDNDAAMFALDRVSLSTALTQHGIAPDSITDVVLTHLHWDHAGGISTRDEDPAAPARAALPHARIHVCDEHLRYAHTASPKDRGSFRASELAVLAASKVQTRTDGELLPQLRATRSQGHTTGLWVIEAGIRGARVVFPADLLPLRAHARPAWGMAYDNRPLVIVEEKRALLVDCASDGALLALAHDPLCAALSVSMKGDRWSVTEATQLRDTPPVE